VECEHLDNLTTSQFDIPYLSQNPLFFGQASEQVVEIALEHEVLFGLEYREQWLVYHDQLFKNGQEITPVMIVRLAGTAPIWGFVLTRHWCPFPWLSGL
jgi:hypothetical protein